MKFPFLILLGCIVLFGVVLYFIKKSHDRTTPKDEKKPELETTQEEVITPTPVKKKRVYKKRVKKV